MTNTKWESSSTARQRQVSSKAVRFDNQSVSPDGQAEPTRHSESGTTLPHPCETSSKPTRSPNTAADTHIQMGETVPSEHLQNLLESGTTLKTRYVPVPSTRSHSTTVDNPIQMGETVPSEQHLQNLLESGTTLKTLSVPVPSTRSHSTTVDTPIQTGETVQHLENLLESGTTLKTLSAPVPSARSHSTTVDTPILTGETVPSEEHLPLSELDTEAGGNVTEPGQVVGLIAVLKTNSEDLSQSQDANSESIEEGSLVASVQEKFHWS